MEQQSDITSTPQRSRSSRSKRRGRYTGTAGFQTEVAVLRAQGMSQRTAGRVLGVNQSTIARIEKLPEVQAKIADLREQWKTVAHNRINEVADSAWNMVKQAADSRDAKAFDASTRGLVALEKISSSVADAPQRVDVSGLPEKSAAETKADIRQLLQLLFPEKDSSRVPDESS